MALKTRQPTGAVPWPLILIEGGEKAGKSWLCAEFSASPRIGQMYWLDLGEGSADEYGAIKGARYLIVEHDGTFSSILTAVEDVHALAAQAAAKGEPPVVLTIDAMTAEWDMLKDWASNRAKGSKSNRAKLAQDPHADIVIANNHWNDANARHRKLMRLLMTFPGVVLMTARGKETALIGDDGKPVEGKRDYRVEAHKNLGYDSSVWVRVFRDARAVVVGARSVHSGIRPGRDDPQELHEDWSLDWFIFEALKCDPTKAHVRDLVEGKPERTPEQIRDEAVEPSTSSARMRELWEDAKRFGYDGVTVDNENGQEELLSKLLLRLGAARKAAEPATDEQHAQMAAMWQRVEIVDAADQLPFIAEIIGREIESSRELTGAEANQVLRRLDGYAKQSQPEAGEAA